MNIRTVAAFLLLCLLLSTCASAAEDDGFVPLFDGKTLDGWKQLGGKAKYEVQDGMIVGSSVPNTANSFLCTEKHYSDFILELEFKVDAGLNSGVQIRSNSLEDYKSGRVHGYQVEIDPSSRAWSGGIYDEGRRGWLNDLKENEPARKAFKQGDQWNQFRVEAVGDSIKTWLNGVPAADLKDSMTPSGFIALQVHGVGGRTEPLRVRWRNIRLKELSKAEKTAAGDAEKDDAEKFVPLFDGKTLDGWHTLPGGKWEVKDGVIVGTSVASEARHGQLVSDKRYKDFTVRLKYKSLKGNSGLYFRVDEVPSPVGVHGFQAEIDPANDVGGLYETGRRAWVVQPTPEQVKQYFKPGEWNEMTVSAQGRHVVVHVNGHKTAELKDDPGRLEGHLALQLHGGQDMHVEVKDVEICVKP